MAKVVIGIDPERRDILERVDSNAARQLHRSARSKLTRTPNEITQTKRLSVDAEPLVDHGPSTGDTLRFSTPPTTRHLTLELVISDAELRDRPEPSGEDASEAPSAEYLAQLPSMSLFAEVPAAVLTRIVSESSLVDLEPGQNLIDRGTTADALFALVEGSVQVIRAADVDAIVLSEGDVVGISCLLDRVCYEGDATARTKVRALRISKLLLDRLVAEHPELEDILLEMLGRRLVATLVRTSPIFASFDDETRLKVAGMFEVRRAHQGTLILKAGKRADGLYIPMIGALTAIDANGEEMGSLKLGRALGQHSMLTQTPSPLTVKAATDVLLLRMSARRFHSLVAAHPKMVAHLEELARRPSAPAFSLIPEPQLKSGA
jgi:CRP-like cAMP-binding protein